MISVVLLASVLVHADPSSMVDDYIRREMAVRRIPGLALAVIKDGKVVKRSVYGYADLEQKTKVKAESVFELASLTKQFTAAAIMLLAEDGALSIDDLLVKHLPDAPTSWKAVSIRHLLNHTAGFATLRNGFKGLPRTTTRTTEAMYENLKTRAPESAPGTRFAYSDEGYFLLGMVIEKASGKKYADFLNERIFRPLGMKTADVPDLRTILPNRVRGYTIYRGDLINIMRQVRTELPSHYGIFATIDDMIKWDLGISRGSLLSHAKWQEAWSPAKLNDRSESPYGFGWSVWDRNGRVTATHTGITGTEITRFYKDSITVVTLTNLGTWEDPENAGVDPWGMTTRISEYFLPSLAFRPIKDLNTSKTDVARSVYLQIVKGKLPTKDVTAGFVDWAGTNHWFNEHYSWLGDLKEFVVVEAGANEATYRATFEKGERFVGMAFMGQLVSEMWPVD